MERKRAFGLRRLLRAFDLPEEVDLNVPRFTLLGNSDFMLENHRGILEYGDALVRLMTTEGVVRVEGTRLVLTEFGSERVYIGGVIFGWRFEGADGCGNS